MKIFMIALSLMMLAGCAHRDRKPSYDYSVLSDSQRQQVAQEQPAQQARPNWMQRMRAVGDGLQETSKKIAPVEKPKSANCITQYLGNGMSSISCH